MNQHHPFTAVTASTIMFVVLLISALSTTSRATFNTLQWKVNQNEDIQNTQDASPTITSELANNMTLVFNVGKEVGDPETLQAILLQETNGGRSEPIGNKTSPVGKRSYGLMQVQTVAARSIFERYPSVFETYFPDRRYSSVADEEIIALLLTDNEANVKIAAYHFKLYKSLAKGDWARTVAGYNAGIGTALTMLHPSEFGYVKDVKLKISNIVRPFNERHGLQLTQRF